jgi:hypothetical protein
MTIDRKNIKLFTMANRAKTELPRRSQQQVRTAVEDGFARIASGAETLLGSDDFGATFTAQMDKAIEEWHEDRATHSEDEAAVLRAGDLDTATAVHHHVAADRGHARHNKAISKLIPDVGEENALRSDFVHIGVLSEFTLSSRTEMRLTGAKTENPNRIRGGDAFQIPMQTLLGRIGIEMSDPPTGSLSFFIVNDAGGRIVQLRVMASKDTKFANIDKLEIALKDRVGHQLKALLKSDKRVFMAEPNNLVGSAKELHVWAMANYA